MFGYNVVIIIYSLSLFLSAVLTLSLCCTHSFSLLYTVPQITEAPGSLENTTPGKPAEFVAKAIGNKLSYTWHRQTAKHLLPNDERVFVGDTQILHIDKVKSSDEGFYVCTICNPTGGSVETNPAQLTTGMPLYVLQYIPTESMHCCSLRVVRRPVPLYHMIYTTSATKYQWLSFIVMYYSTDSVWVNEFLCYLDTIFSLYFT